MINKKVIWGLAVCIGVIATVSLRFMGEAEGQQTGIKALSAVVNQTDLQNLQEEGFWYDAKNKLLWYRCHPNQEFVKNSCEGDAISYPFDSAIAEVHRLNEIKWKGYATWRLPEIHELHGLVNCSTGFLDQTTLPNAQWVDHGCQPKNYQRPTIDLSNFPNTQSDWYWSATNYALDSSVQGNTAWGAYMSSGYVYDLTKQNQGYVYIVTSLDI